MAKGDGRRKGRGNKVGLSALVCAGTPLPANLNNDVSDKTTLKNCPTPFVGNVNYLLAFPKRPDIVKRSDRSAG
jgi:hypothetical protein